MKKIQPGVCVVCGKLANETGFHRDGLPAGGCLMVALPVCGDCKRAEDFRLRLERAFGLLNEDADSVGKRLQEEQRRQQSAELAK